MKFLAVQPKLAFKALGLLGIGRVALADMTTMTTYTLAAPQITPPPTQASAYAKDFSFTVINSHTAAVSTQHEQGSGSPTAAFTGSEGDIVAPRETISFTVPIGVSPFLGLEALLVEKVVFYRFRACPLILMM